MAGHSVTPYEVTATRKYVRDEAAKQKPLLLASIAPEATVDLLDLVDEGIVNVDPIVNKDRTRSLRCVAAERSPDYVAMVFASDVSGEREVVHDGEDPALPVKFTKGGKDVASFLSCSVLWRPPDGTNGLLLVHSPWGRGGSKSQIVTLLQRAVDTSDGAKAKLHADPIIPAKALERILSRANATRITYTKSKGVTSTFGDAGGASTSARAEMDLVVKGSDSIPFRDALTAALKASASREKLFTLRVRDNGPSAMKLGCGVG